MIKSRIRPVLLLAKNRLVKTKNFSNPRYLGDPINAVKIFNDKEVDELVILDIDASKNKSDPNFELLTDILSEAFMPVAYGGGVNNMQQVTKLISIGVEKLIFNSVISHKPNFISEVASSIGSSSVVVSIDVKRNFFGKYTVRTMSGTFDTKIDPVQYAREIERLGAGEIMLGFIDNDGMCKGYDLELISLVSKSISIPLIAVGGASKLDDLKLALNAGASASAAGSIFVYHGKHQGILINYPDSSEFSRFFNGM